MGESSTGGQTPESPADPEIRLAKAVGAPSLRPSMHACLIFDLDGTLVDSLPAIAASLNRTLAQHHMPGHPESVVRSFIGNGLRNLLEQAAPRDTPPGVIDELLETYRADYDATWPSGTVVYPGIHDLLVSLRDQGTTLAVLSNKVDAFTRTMTAVLFPEIPFGCVLGQRDGVPHKPDPSGALEIKRALGASAEKCTIVGDSTVDLETARNAGMRFIGVSWGYHGRARLEEAGAGTVVDHASQIPG